MNVARKETILVISNENEKPNEDLAKAVGGLLPGFFQGRSLKLGHEDMLKMRLVCKDWNEVILASKHFTERTIVFIPESAKAPDSLLEKAEKTSDEKEKAALQEQIDALTGWKWVSDFIDSFKHKDLLAVALKENVLTRGVRRKSTAVKVSFEELLSNSEKIFDSNDNKSSKISKGVQDKLNAIRTRSLLDSADCVYLNPKFNKIGAAIVFTWEELYLDLLSKIIENIKKYLIFTELVIHCKGFGNLLRIGSYGESFKIKKLVVRETNEKNKTFKFELPNQIETLEELWVGTWVTRESKGLTEFTEKQKKTGIRVVIGHGPDEVEKRVHSSAELWEFLMVPEEEVSSLAHEVTKKARIE